MADIVEFRKASEDISKLETKARRVPLKDGGGGGTFDPMEARVAKLEEIASDTRVTLARIDERMNSLATKEDVGKIQGTLASKVDYKWFAVAVVGLTMVLMRAEIAGWIQAATG